MPALIFSPYDKKHAKVLVLNVEQANAAAISATMAKQAELAEEARKAAAEELERENANKEEVPADEMEAYALARRYKALFHGHIGKDVSPGITAQQFLRGDTKRGIEVTVSWMNDNVADVELQIHGINILCRLGHQSNHVQLHNPAGMLRSLHHDMDNVSELAVALQKAGAIGIVLQAIQKHTGNRVCVMRALWTLQQLIANIDSRRVFEADGGKQLMQTVEALYKRDHEIMSALTEIRRPFVAGKTKNCVIM